MYHIFVLLHQNREGCLREEISLISRLSLTISARSARNQR